MGLKKKGFSILSASFRAVMWCDDASDVGLSRLEEEISFHSIEILSFALINAFNSHAQTVKPTCPSTQIKNPPFPPFLTADSP